MSSIKISRQDKNLMRKQLEEILSIQKDLDKKIDNYQQESVVEEYRGFWQELGQNNKDSIQRVSRYMVRKCNR
ncbi:hypothetical protein [Syntrophomonas wolfei]|uniref:Uncharacterized protein n=1 Tax=Syntrophomonas wolfei subsp. wolfei (strain DSM 2245B / Goettingen) TaxID=335541 RepID=Q0B0T5_SYNWW|nr:hypothetical protein [Syntrophomonas wolfei]ABI67419.1 hypothetical protein Swol_0061 [Syntrophomonas wolfei subsp. wolfei str. Goettingen G311]